MITLTVGTAEFTGVPGRAQWTSTDSSGLPARRSSLSDPRRARYNPTSFSRQVGTEVNPLRTFLRTLTDRAATAYVAGPHLADAINLARTIERGWNGDHHRLLERRRR